MMKIRTMLVVALTALLIACGPQSQSIPRYDDMEGLLAISMSLSPWVDGSPDRSNDGMTPGERGSDRATFSQWMIRYHDHETYAQYNKNYRPFPVPGSVAEALRDQRAFEAEAATRDAAKAEANAKAQADVAAGRQRAEAQRAAEEAAADAREAVAVQASDAEGELARQRQATVEKEQEDCAVKRQDAMIQAESADQPRVYESFACENIR